MADFTGRNIVTTVTARRLVEKPSMEVRENVKRLISDNHVYFIIDETSDRGRCVINILVGILNGKPSRAMLLDVYFEDTTNHQIICMAVFESCKKLWSETNIYSKLDLIVTGNY